MKTLSICLIVKNEEKNIKECLLNINSIADEVIVIDTGSSDKTIDEITSINDKKIKIFSHTWNYDFSEARNKSFEYATSDYLMFFDADERCQKNLKEIISQLKNDNFLQKKALNITIKHTWSNEHIHFFENTRIVSREINPKWIYSVHENLVFDNTEIYRIEPKHGYIIHQKDGGCDKNFYKYYNFYFLDKLLNRDYKDILYNYEFCQMSHAIFDGIAMRYSFFNIFNNSNITNDDYRFLLLANSWIDFEESLVLSLIHENNKNNIYYIHQLSSKLYHTHPFASYHALNYIRNNTNINVNNELRKLTFKIGLLNESEIKTNGTSLLLDINNDIIFSAMPIFFLKDIVDYIFIHHKYKDFAEKLKIKNIIIIDDYEDIKNYNNVNSIIKLNPEEEVITFNYLSEIVKDCLNNNTNKHIILNEKG